MAGRPRLITANTPRDREILICSETDDPPFWGFGVWDDIAKMWFRGGVEELEDLQINGYAADPRDYYWDNPTHWAELPALPRQQRDMLH